MPFSSQAQETRVKATQNAQLNRADPKPQSASKPAATTSKASPGSPVAAAQNTASTGYNQALLGYEKTYNSLGSQMNWLNTGSYWDDPNTTQNENAYYSMRDSMSALKNQISGLSFDQNDANTTLYNQMMNGLGEWGTNLENGWQARQAEEARIKGFSTNMLGSLAPLKSSLGSMTIADLGRINDADAQLAALNAQRSGFSSPILNQVMPNGFTDLDAQLGSIGSSISGLRGNLTAEQKRIKDLETSLYAGADDISGRLSGLSIGDLSGLNAAKAELDKLYTTAGRFESDLEFDFSQEMGAAGLDGASANLDRLFRERDAEEARVRSAEQDFRNRGYGLEDLANGLSVYNLDNLTQAQRRVSNLRNEANSFSSALPFNFQDGDLEGLDAASSRLSQLMSDRSTQLAEITGRMGTPLSGISEIALNDEATMNSRRNSMNDLLREVSQYTGSDTAGMRSQLTGGMSAVDGRLKELATQRTTLETQAKELMTRVQDASYYTSAGLTEDQAAMEQMRDQIKLYNAQQAMDELTSIEKRMLGEQSRLVSDEGAAAERERAGQSAVRKSIGQSGVPQFSMQTENPELQALYQRFLYQSPEEEQLYAAAPTGAFSSALSFGG